MKRPVYFERFPSNLMGKKKILSCSFHLYRFHKYVPYGFAILNFCNPRVHYETPCIIRTVPEGEGCSRHVWFPGAATYFCEANTQTVLHHLPRAERNLFRILTHGVDQIMFNCALQCQWFRHLSHSFPEREEKQQYKRKLVFMFWSCNNEQWNDNDFGRY